MKRRAIFCVGGTSTTFFRGLKSGSSVRFILKLSLNEKMQFNHGLLLGLPTVTSFNKGHMENIYQHNFQSHLYHYIYASVACGDL